MFKKEIKHVPKFDRQCRRRMICLLFINKKKSIKMLKIANTSPKHGDKLQLGLKSIMRIGDKRIEGWNTFQ